MDLNRITLIGRMGSELTTKTIGEGEAAKQVASFRFAVNSPFDDQATSRTKRRAARVPGSSRKARRPAWRRPPSLSGRTRSLPWIPKERSQ
jgi:hypothetical protein